MLCKLSHCYMCFTIIRYTNEKHATASLKQELLHEIQRPFSSSQCSRNSYVGEYIATSKEQTDFLKNEEIFLRKDLSDKNELIKSVFQNYFNSEFNLQKGSSKKFTRKTIATKI